MRCGGAPRGRRNAREADPAHRENANGGSANEASKLHTAVFCLPKTVTERR
jgi:hypothetical protein